MSYEAGDARIRIIPDASRFLTDLENDLKRKRAEFSVDVTADTTAAAAEIDRFVARQSGRDITIGVNVDRRRMRNDATEAVRSVMGEVGEAFSSAGQALKFPLIFAGIGEIPAATTALANLAGALQQVAQAGLLIPGVIASATASISTLSLGISGVSDAYDAITKASDSAGTGQARSAATAARSQRELNNAYRDARTELADLQLQLRGGQLSQEQAILGAQMARRQLQRDLASGQIADQLDLQQDLLAIRQADQRVAEVTQNNINLQQRANEENAKGIAGNDRVVAAQEAVASAATSAGGAADKASAAMAKLAPNAREFVQAIIDLKPEFTDLQQTVQQELFAGLSTQLRTLVDADLPHLRSGMSEVAQAWNGTFKQLGETLGSDSSLAILDRIMSGTADAMVRMEPAIDPLVTAIGTLAAAGTEGLPRLADDFAELSEKFNAFITTADQDGSLDRWINEGITAVEHLGSTLLNIGDIFTAITRAAGGGEGLLGMLDRGTERLANFLNSVEGQNKLKAWFEEGRREIQEHIIPLLQSLPGLFSGMVQAGQVIADDVVPPLRDMAHFLSEHETLVKNVAIAFVAWKTLDGVTSLIGNLKQINDLLGVGGGKGGRGGKGILGKLALVTVAGVALDTFLDDDGQPRNDATPPGVPIAPSAAPTGQIPAGQAAPFAGIPIITPNVAGAAAAGATAGGVAGSTFGPWGTLIGAGIGAATAVPGAPADDRSPAVKDVDQIIYALPQLPDDMIKPIADQIGLSVDQVKAMPRDELRARMLATLNQQANPPAPLPIPTRAAGGPTPSGRGGGPTGGFLAEVHSDEWVLPAHARAAIGDTALWALTKGRSFDVGGTVDQFGNPIVPGGAPGPAPGPIAPNPTQTGTSSIVSSFLSGLGGVAGNVSALAGAVPGLTGGGANPASGLVPSTLGDVHGLGGVPGIPNTMASTAASATGGGLLGGGRMIPGLAGLFQAGGDQNLLNAWGTKTGDWLGQFGAKTLTSLTSTLWQGALGLVGLENSILSPNNAWFQAGSQTAGFFLGQDGPFGKGGASTMPYAGDTNSVGMQTITLTDGTQIQVPTYGTSVTTAGATAGGATAGAPAAYGSGTARLPEKGVQRYTIAAADAIGAAFPAIKDIGGYRAPDGYNEHSSGQAADVMIPDWSSSGGKSLGDQVAAFALQQPGVDYVIWRQAMHYRDGRVVPMNDRGDPNQNHFTHVHVHTSGGGYPTGDGGLPTGNGPSPQKKATGGAIAGSGTGDTVPAMLTPGEHVFTTADVDAMGGQPGVYAFRKALHFAAGGGVPLPSGAVIRPLPTPDAQQIAPKPAPAPRPAPSTPTPPAAVAPTAPGTAPAAVAPTAPSGPAAPTTAPPRSFVAGPAPVAPAAANVSDSLNHNLPAVSKGISSGASAIGQALSTAIGIAGGAGGGFGGGALGAIGPYAAGLVQQGGKVVDDAVNVVSSFLVGNVTPGTTENAYGETLRSPQRVPQTAVNERRGAGGGLGGGATYNIQAGYKPDDIIDAIRLKESQDRQARLARFGG